jgi:GTPase SAR1 family protein
MAELLNDNDHNEHLSELQKDVLHLFQEVVTTFRQAQQLHLEWAVGTGGTDALLKQLEIEGASVRELELRIPVVAQMKAGKSTLINAIVGYELLPHRNMPMTTLPTKIIVTDEVAEPELLLGTTSEAAAANASLFTELTARLSRTVGSPGHSGLGETSAHLQPTVDRLRDAEQLPSFGGPCQGLDSVQEHLGLLNDLLRLAALQLSNDDYAGRLQDVPVLRTPVKRLPGQATAVAGRGHLAIVDTPGPDEQGIGDRLTEVVARELDNSHVVLVVLDFTKMGSEADKSISDLAEKVLGRIGREKLYVAVNKIDQRTDRSLDPAGVSSYVRHSLELRDDDAETRIFECAAWKGLLARTVLAELGAEGEAFEIEGNRPVRKFLEEVIKDPDFLEEFLLDLEVERLHGMARRAWRDCGVPGLLDGALRRLRDNVVPGVLGSALQKLDPELAALDDAINTREKMMTASQQEVASQLEELDREVEALKQVEDQRPQVAYLRQRVEAEMQRLLTDVHKQGRQALRALDSDDPGSDRTPSLTRPYRAVKSMLSTVLSGKAVHEERVYKLASLDEARRVQTDLTAAVSEQLRRVLDAGRESLRGVTEQLARDELRTQEQRARPIILRAAERLSTTFDIKPRVPPLVVSDRGIEVGLAAPEVHRKDRRVRYTVTERQRNPWTLWITHRNVQVTRWREETEEVYLVALDAIRRELEIAFDENLSRIRTELHRYVTDDLSEQISAYFAYLDEFLAQYQHHLVQSQQDFRKTEEDQQALRGQLAHLSAGIVQHRSSISDYRQQLDD